MTNSKTDRFQMFGQALSAAVQPGPKKPQPKPKQKAKVEKQASSKLSASRPENSIAADATGNGPASPKPGAKCEQAGHPPSPSVPRKHAPVQKTANELRSLRPDFKIRLLARMIKVFSAGGVAVEALPAVFTQPQVVPLKLGIDKDIAERFSLTSDEHKAALHALLRTYCRQLAYFNACIAVSDRYDLDLTKNGTVDEEHKQGAKLSLQGAIKSIRKRQNRSGGQ